ncbi:MAG: TIGR04283 family arsenosugar biosynthesis glycosyltransferase [Marinosulfonomonas sp.]
MRAPLSIVIPTLNAAEHLPGTLASLMEGIEDGILRELIISDGGSQDATCQIAEAAGAVLVTGGAGRGAQLQRGAEAAGGPWILFLHADTQLSPGWTQAVATHLDGQRAGYFKLAFAAPGVLPRLVAGGANLRSRFGLPYGDQGLLIRRALYQKLGGYRDMPLMEDVEFARRLRGQLSGLPVTATTSATRYQKTGWLRTSLRNIGTLARYQLGADPKDLARRYYDRDSSENCN